MFDKFRTLGPAQIRSGITILIGEPSAHRDFRPTMPKGLFADPTRLALQLARQQEYQLPALVLASPSLLHGLACLQNPALIPATAPTTHLLPTTLRITTHQ